MHHEQDEPETAPVMALSTLLPEQLRHYAEQLDALYALVEFPQDGVEVDERVEAFLGTATPDLVLAAGQHLKVVEASVRTAKDERARIQRVQQRLESEAKWIRELLGKMLARLGEKSVRGPTVTVRASKGVPSVEQLQGADLYLLPPELRRDKPPEPRKPEIKARLQAGGDVPGFRLVRRPGVTVL